MDSANFSKLKPGRILFTTITDMNGVGAKDRPVLVLTTPTGSGDDDTFRIVGGSTKPPATGNERLSMKVIGLNQPNGHPRTGLKSDTWFYAMWGRTVKLGNVRRVAKGIGMPPADFINFMAVLNSLKKQTWPKE